MTCCVAGSSIRFIEMMFFSYSTEQLFIFNNNDCTLRSIFFRRTSVCLLFSRKFHLNYFRKTFFKNCIRASLLPGLYFIELLCSVHPYASSGNL